MGRTVSWLQLGSMAVSAALLTGLGGCDDTDPAAEAVDQAVLELEAVALRGGSALDRREAAREGYRTVLTTLRSAEGSGPEARKSTVAMMMAEAHLGLDTAAFDAAVDTELDCLRKEATIRNLQDNWMTRKSLESALRQFDPGDEIARLEADRTERAAQIEATNEELSQLQEELNGTRERIARLEEQAQAKWEEETSIRREAVDRDEVEREPLIREANEVKRQGDELDRQASELEAELKAREPELRDIEAEIRRLTVQSEQLTGAIEGLRRQRAERQRLADEASQEASELADRLTTAVSELNDLREQAPPAWEEVRSACDAALGKANAAARSREARGLAKVQAGAASQLLGDALWQQAAGVAAYESTMQLLADSPGLPNADQYGQAAAGAEQRYAELIDQANAAYREAADAFQSAADAGVEGAEEDLAKPLAERAGRPPSEMEEEAPMEAPGGEGGMEETGTDGEVAG